MYIHLTLFEPIQGHHSNIVHACSPYGKCVFFFLIKDMHFRVYSSRHVKLKILVNECGFNTEKYILFFFYR